MLLYLFREFLIIGSVSFGGYMALIAMVRNRLVTRDQLLPDSRLSEGIAIASLLPGPVAVNVVAYLGYTLSGIWGAIISIIAVLLPSFVMVVGLGFLYYKYDSVYDFSLLLSGIIPVVVAIIISVGVSMGRKNVKKTYQVVITILTVLTLYIFPGYWSSVLVLTVSALTGIVLGKENNISSDGSRATGSLNYIWWLLAFLVLFVGLRYLDTGSIGTKLFTLFSSVSLTLFGGGYVMIPILKSILVDQLAWFGADEFGFGISIGQVTPGPILISAAFFGYKMWGIKGALISTIGIFLPSSMLMIFTSQVYQNIRNNILLKAAMTGVMPAVVGLIIYSGITLFLNHVEQNPLVIALAIFIVSFALAIKFQKGYPVLLFAGLLMAYLFSKI